MTFFAFQGTDKHKTVEQHLADAIARYREKHGRQPTLCLTSHADAAALADAAWHGQDVPEMEIQSVPFVARHCFYLAAATWALARMGEPA